MLLTGKEEVRCLRAHTGRLQKDGVLNLQWETGPLDFFLFFLSLTHSGFSAGFRFIFGFSWFVLGFFNFGSLQIFCYRGRSLLIDYGLDLYCIDPFQVVSESRGNCKPPF